MKILHASALLISSFRFTAILTRPRINHNCTKRSSACNREMWQYVPDYQAGRLDNAVLPNKLLLSVVMQGEPVYAVISEYGQNSVLSRQEIFISWLGDPGVVTKKKWRSLLPIVQKYL